ncbi:MAG: DUF4920 domain-containing protein [Phycisphaerae bacterium]|nr:DUF4920 domain-containing protein [Phycisphaerae bacterium]
MNRSLGLLCLASLGLVVWTGCAGKMTQFGEPMKNPTQKPLTVTHVLSEPEKYEGQQILVRGTVRALCEHSGCWMELAHNASDEGEGLVVVFTYDKELGRLPVEAKGREALAEGTLVVKEISEAQRRHRAKEQGMSELEIAGIIGPKESIRLECPAAKIEGVEPVEPKACKHE